MAKRQPPPPPPPAAPGTLGLAALEEAARIVYAAMPPTPQYRWPLLCERLGLDVWVKHENHTPVGAFKVRGGLVFLERLRRERPELTGVVTATRGNHGQSIAFAAARHGLRVVVVVPEGNSREKNAAMRALGAELVVKGRDFQASAEHADQLAKRQGLYRLPSFHPWLVAGVASYALEFLRAVPALDLLYVPIGLGSGICGVLEARDALGLRTEVVGVVSSGAPAYARSLAAGRPVSHPVTTVLADGMACRTPDPQAFERLRHGVARIVEVDDAQVADAMRILFADTHNAAEGAGAAGLAALLREHEAARGRTAGIVLCGANVDTARFAAVLRHADLPPFLGVPPATVEPGDDA